VSYGAAIAALAATMGDASWVLLAADPALTVQLKLLLLAAGAVTGWVVDAAGVAPRRRVATRPARPAAPVATPVVTPAALPTRPAVPRPAFRVHELGVLPVLSACWSAAAQHRQPSGHLPAPR
jgi:hypothetical protein